jgi:hypothetical protein
MSYTLARDTSDVEIQLNNLLNIAGEFFIYILVWELSQGICFILPKSEVCLVLALAKTKFIRTVFKDPVRTAQ